MSRPVDPTGAAHTFIRDHTRLLPVPLVPEIHLHLAHEAIALWECTEEELGEIGLPPPFWAFAWAGGQALARYVLDHPDVVAGRSILDLASGSGLVAIAAAKAGAVKVVAADIDRFAAVSCMLNAEANSVAVEPLCEDLLETPPPPFEVVLVGDLFYERPLAERALRWLERAAKAGAEVLIGDPGRSYLPRQRLDSLAAYSVPVTRDLEDAEIKRTCVWRLAPAC